MIFKKEKEKIVELQRKVEILQSQIGDLVHIFGFCRDADESIYDSDSDMDTQFYTEFNKNKLPVKTEDFNLLLDYFKIVKETKTESERFIKKLKREGKVTAGTIKIKSK